MTFMVSMASSVQQVKREAFLSHLILLQGIQMSSHLREAG